VPVTAVFSSAVLGLDEIRRYDRQVALPEIGVEGQLRIKRATVLLVGAGGLGSPAALYLVAAGIGRIVLVDFDEVDDSNLQRQILYSTADVGRSKADAATDRLRALNPHVIVEVVREPFGARNGRRLTADADVVIDGSDNFPTRYLVNDACVLERTPNVYGSIRAFEGQASVFAAPGGPCYRCLHPEPPPDGLIPSCAEGGVLGVLPGVIGAIQATEAIKLIAGIGRPLVGRLLLYDAYRMRIREIVLPRDADCAACGDSPSISELVSYDQPPCDSPIAGQTAEISASELRDWRATGRPHVLIDVREPDEHAIQAIEGARLVPLGSIEREADRLPRDRPVVVHCRTGRRSGQAAGRLRKLGFDARSLAGGIDAWMR
jgi:adenylyltransferase/sulfurtransferase